MTNITITEANVIPTDSTYNIFTNLTLASLLLRHIFACIGIVSNLIVIITFALPFYKRWKWKRKKNAERIKLRTLPRQSTKASLATTTTVITTSQIDDTPNKCVRILGANKKDIFNVVVAPMDGVLPVTSAGTPTRIHRSSHPSEISGSIFRQHIPRRPSLVARPDLSVVTLLIIFQSLIDFISMSILLGIVTTHLVHQTWPGGDDGFLCQFDGFVHHCFAAQSVSNLVIIAHERKRTIVDEKHFTIRDAINWHCFGWIISIIQACIPFMSNDETLTGKYVIHPSGSECYGYGRHIQTFMVVILYFGILIPYMLYCYFRVYRTVKCTFGDVMAMVSTTSSSPQQQRMKNQQEMVGVLMLVFSVLMCICWIPCCIGFLLIVAEQPISAEFDVILLCAATASFVLNPIIYGVFDRTVRSNLVGILCCRYACSTTRSQSSRVSVDTRSVTSWIERHTPQTPTPQVEVSRFVTPTEAAAVVQNHKKATDQHLISGHVNVEPQEPSTTHMHTAPLIMTPASTLPSPLVPPSDPHVISSGALAPIASHSHSLSRMHIESHVPSHVEMSVHVEDAITSVVEEAPSSSQTSTLVQVQSPIDHPIDADHDTSLDVTSKKLLPKLASSSSPK